jgi:Zn-dependent protease with chaperone function
MSSPGRSLALRASLAAALLITFYALALAVAVGLVGLGLAVGGALLSAGRIHVVGLFFAAAAILGGLIVLWSILPRIDRFEPPGPELSAADFPALFAEIHGLARAAGQAPPVHVYLVPDVNAFVAQRGGVMGIGSRRVMGIGLGMLEAFTVSELRAVIVHEFGHFHGGDTRLGPWIYKTRGAVIRTVGNLERAHDATVEISVIPYVLRAVRWPFAGFAALFLRITQRISRAQEYAADALAVRIAGADAVIDGFRKVAGASAAWTGFVHGEVGPAFSAGFAPPMASGFRQFLAHGDIRDRIASASAEMLAEAEADPLDSHPLLRDRIAAAEALRAGAPPAIAGRDDRPAHELVPGIAAVELALARSMVVDHHELTATEWSALVEQVYLPAWRDELASARRTLRGLTLATVPAAIEKLTALAEVRFDGDTDGMTEDHVKVWATRLFGSAFTLALVGRGATVTTAPGAQFSAVIDGTELLPFTEVGNYLKGETTAEAWAARLGGLGVAEVDLTALGDQKS